MLNILVCQLFRIHKPLFSTSRAITKDTVQWKRSALSKVPSPISDHELMYLKFMLTWYTIVRLHLCSRAEEEGHPLLLTFCVGFQAIPKGVNSKQLGREWEGRIKVEFDSAIPYSLTHVLVQKKLL